MKKKLIFLSFMAAAFFANAQSVSINSSGATADASAMLDISSNTKGLLIPRMTRAQRTAITTPKNGLIVYDSSNASFWFYKQNQWQELASNTTTSDSSLIYGQQAGALASYNLNATTNTTIVSDSSGYIYDSGGPAGNYGNDEFYYIIIYAEGINVIGYNLQVINNSLEIPNDTLFIGSAGVNEIIDTLTGSETASYTFPNAPVYVLFKSNASNTAAGFKIRWDVITGPSVSSSNPPLAGWYFIPEKIAMHGGYNFLNQWHKDSSGFASFNYGYGNKAKGDYSTALGYYTNASGKYSTAIGNTTIASGEHSTSMGNLTTATNTASTSWGTYTKASGEYATAFGSNTIASGFLSTAWGIFSEASGHNSTAFGSFTKATANYSFASGASTTASGDNSTAFGNNTVASGYASTSFGLATTASGNESTAMGNRIHTNSKDGSFAIGDNNVYSTLGNDIENQMLMRFGGGYKFNLNDSTMGMAVDPNGNVGIGTGTPLSHLHVTGGSILFSANGNIPFQKEFPPIQEAGRRMMWYADKAAFRSGYVDGIQWNMNNIGDYSFASGYNVTASGNSSIAIGYNLTASGGGAIAMGNGSIASGPSSIAIGHTTNATGFYSTAMGYTTRAEGLSSTALGYNTTAQGTSSTAMGESTTAKSGFETVFGSWNTDYTPTNVFGWSPADRLFVIGNGTGPGTARSNAITVLKNGNVGIGTSTPAFPLSFATSTGDKISLYGNSGPHYGFGVTSGLLQIHSDAMLADIAFGYGSSSSFNETMRIRGNGNLEVQELKIGNGTLVSKHQAGNAVVGTNGSNFKIFTLTFPTAFTGIPNVTATAKNDPVYSEAPDTFCVTVRSVSTTTVTFNIVRVDLNAGWLQNLLLAWQAWE